MNCMKTMNTKEIHLITTDLDGTLLNQKSIVSDYNKAQLLKAKEQGIIVVLNSGRPYSAIKDRIPNSLYDYASCMNGQDIYCLKDNSHWENERLKREDIEVLFEIGKHYPVIMDCKDAVYHIQACHPSYRMIGKLFAMIHDLIWSVRGYQPNPTPLVVSAKDIPMQTAGKFCFAGKHKTLEKILKQLPNHLQGTYVNSKWLEVQCQGVDKGSALKEIMKRENITMEHSAGFGDGENDISMLKQCKYRIVMENAMEKTKEVATEITLSNKKDGVGVWLEKNIFESFN